jgi:hypothetical protein
MREDRVDLLLQFGVCEPASPRAVKGHVRLFEVPEPAKQRWRPIKHTHLVNDTFPTRSVEPVFFPSKREICNLVHLGSHFIGLDFASWFDQFTYAPALRDFFCFRSPSGKLMRLRTLAMGQRQAVSVAHTATELLLDFPKTCTSKAIIDNSIFVGSRAQCIADTAKFIERVSFVGAKLNEDTSDLEALVSTAGEWGGIVLDFSSKSSCLSQKCVDKTSFSWNQRRRWTWRLFAAHMGLLFWAWGIIELPMPDFFPVLRFVSEVGKIMTASPEKWDDTAVIWPSVWPLLERWTTLVLANSPRHVPKNSVPELLLACDASAYGWGYVALNTVSGEVFVHGEPWSSSARRRFGDRLLQSVVAEPQGIVNSLCHLLRPGMPRVVQVGTDSSVSAASFSRGFNSHSFDINECLRRCKDYFGNDFQLSFTHIPGRDNPADGVSRGTLASDVNREFASGELRRVLGTRALRADPLSVEPV